MFVRIKFKQNLETFNITAQRNPDPGILLAARTQFVCKVDICSLMMLFYFV